MEILTTLVVTVAADLISHQIRKWLDGDKRKKDEKKQPEED